MNKKLLLSLMFILGLAFQLYAQRTVTGQVSDDDGESIPGVTVLVKGTSQGTVTDIDGKYTIQILNDEAVLVFKYVGFLDQEVVVGAQSVIDVSLKTDVKQLEEVVVTGYGEQIKQDLTGNIAQIKSESIANTPVPSFESAVQGRAAGVFVEAENGKFEGHSVHEVKRLKGSVDGFAYDADALVFPIPQREMLANPNMVQNSGY